MYASLNPPVPPAGALCLKELGLPLCVKKHHGNEPCWNAIRANERTCGSTKEKIELKHLYLRDQAAWRENMMSWVERQSLRKVHHYELRQEVHSASLRRMLST